MPATSLRRIAASAGQRRYVTGLPCKYGHIAERFTSSGACVECVALARAIFTATMREARGQEPPLDTL